MEIRSETIKEKVTSNLAWRFLERVTAQVVSFAVYIAIARIVDRSEYGTLALITVFTNILQVFVDSGLGNALIQKKDADDLDFSTVFYANVVFCIVLYIGIYLTAPFIASFYNNEAIAKYVRVISVTVLISGVKNVQQAYVSRKMLFRKFFFSTVGGTVVAGVIGVALARGGYGIWALVFQQVVRNLIDTIILWVTVKWRPLWAFSLERLEGLFDYGWKLLVSSLFDSVYGSLRQLIIGKLYTSDDLADYDQGTRIPSLIVTNVNASIDSVLLPAMSRVQDKAEEVKKMVKRSIKTSAFVMAPMMIGLAFVGDLLVKVVLTDKWLGMVPFMRVYCIIYIFYPIHTANLNAMKAMGRSDLFLKLEIIKKVAGLIVLIISVHYGVMAMAYSLLLTSVINQVVNSWPNKHLINYGYVEQVKDILPSILLALFMGLCVMQLRRFNLGDSLTLVIQIIGGGLIYIAGSFLLKSDSLLYLTSILNQFIRK